MRERTRDLLAAAIGVAAIALGMGSLLFTRVDPALQIGRSGDRFVVTWVGPWGQAQRDGVLPGMVVVALNSVPLLDLPQPIYPDTSFDADGNPIVGEPTIVPPAPTPINISDDAY